MLNNSQLVGWSQINLPIFFRATKPFNHCSFLPDILALYCRPVRHRAWDWMLPQLSWASGDISLLFRLCSILTPPSIRVNFSSKLIFHSLFAFLFQQPNSCSIYIIFHLGLRRKYGVENEPLAKILGETSEEDENLAYKGLQSQMKVRQRNNVLLLISVTCYYKIILSYNIYCVVWVWNLVAHIEGGT